MDGVISAGDPKWIELFSGLTEVQFVELVALVRCRGGDVQRGRPRRLPLVDRVLLVATYGRTNLTLRQVAPLFGVSKSAADRILDHVAPLLTIFPARRPRKDTVYTVDGTLVPPVPEHRRFQQELPVLHEPAGRHRCQQSACGWE